MDVTGTSIEFCGPSPAPTVHTTRSFPGRIQIRYTDRNSGEFTVPRYMQQDGEESNPVILFNEAKFELDMNESTRVGTGLELVMPGNVCALITGCLDLSYTDLSVTPSLHLPSYFGPVHVNVTNVGRNKIDRGPRNVLASLLFLPYLNVNMMENVMKPVEKPK